MYIHTVQHSQPSYTEKLTFMSVPVKDYMLLGHHHTYTNSKLAMLHYKDDMQKKSID